jgi:hypothetical protein
MEISREVLQIGQGSLYPPLHRDVVISAARHQLSFTLRCKVHDLQAEAPRPPSLLWNSSGESEAG